MPDKSSDVSTRVGIARVARSIVGCTGFLVRGRLHQPSRHVGGALWFADGTRARIFRETVVDRQRPRTPAVLVVEFRLRVARERTHRVVQRLSVLATPLFAGFPGFVSKLWLTDDKSRVYREIYEFDGAAQAESYAETLRWILRRVVVAGTFECHVVTGECWAGLVAQAECLAADAPPDMTAAWRPT
ncbi:hypothetical protein [Mycobacterium sp.]|uniref:hypothetical protein n=1 Tax=Mycobacterium sp. TaxID=1785 RepID=UPI0012772F77|nr:hypothetical protein [Mycobacterium sp.]KAA8964663.1 MAG: YdhR family protein [Mycobacterium sp.]